MTKGSIAVFVCLLPGVAPAAPMQFEPCDGSAFTVSMPKSWKITTDAAHTVIVAQQDPSRKDAAALLLTVQPGGNHASEDKLLDVVAAQVAKDLKVSRRDAIPGGGHMMIADGTAGDLEVRVGAIALTASGGAITGVLVSNVADFDALGGIGLVATMMGSGKLDMPPPRPLTLADLVGQWDKDDGSIQSYVNTSTGGYAGYHAVSTSARYTITAEGAVTINFSGYSGGTGGGIYASDAFAGTITISADGVLEIIIRNGSNKTGYLVSGWFQSPKLTVLKLNSPWYDGIPAGVRADPGKGWSEYWVRKAPGESR